MELYNLIMVNSQSQVTNITSYLARIIPGIILGLFVGRVISELIRPNTLGAIVITIACVIVAALVVSRLSFSWTWPCLLLLLYVIYPEADLKAASFTVLLFVLVLILNYWSDTNQFLGKFRLNPLVAGILLGGSFLALYLLTISPDILPADSGEFQLVATELGIAHPPGFTLYTMLAHLMTRLPFAQSPAYMVNLFSVIVAVTTLLIVYYSVFTLTKSVIAGIAAGLTLGAAATFWAQATGANIRGLTALFTAIMMLAVIKMSQISREVAEDDQSVNPYNDSKFRRDLLILLLLAASLSLGITHHPSLAFLALVILPFIIFFIPRQLRVPKVLLLVLLFALVGLVPLIYLPLRAYAGVLGTPDDLLTPSGFLNHVLALGFRGDLFYFDDPVIFWNRLRVMANVANFQFPPLILATMMLGILLALWLDRWLGLLLTIAIALYTIVAASYRAPQTVEYMMPTYVLGAIAVGYLGGKLRHSLAIVPKDHRYRRVFVGLSVVTIGLILVTGVWVLIDRYPSFAYLHADTSTRDYAQPLLEQAPTDGVILADWHWATPLWYLQRVEDLRPDVRVDFVFPTGEVYADTWARRIEEEFKNGRSVIATHYNESAYVSLPTPEPLNDAFLFSQEARMLLPAEYIPLNVSLGEEIELLGFDLTAASLTPGSETVLALAWQNVGDIGKQKNFYAHLVNSKGMVYGQDDVRAIAQPEGITLTQLRLTPLIATPPGVYELLIGSYGQNLAPFEETITDTVISPISIIPLVAAPATKNSANRLLANSDDDNLLVGYDWDNTIQGNRRLYLHWQNDEGFETESLDLMDEAYMMPDWIGPWGQTVTGSLLEPEDDSYYVPQGQGIIWTGPTVQNQQSLEPGETLELAEEFISSKPVVSDLTVSVRLVGYEEDGFHWAWWDLVDGTPAMGAIPTLKWISDSRVRDPHWPGVSDLAYPGQTVEPLLRLYDAFTGRPLPILDERLNSQAPWIPLGKVMVTGG